MQEQSKSEGFDLEEVAKGMSPAELTEFLKKQLTPEAAQAYLKEKRGNQLKVEYDKEMAGVKANLSTYAKLQRMSAIKAKSRAKGLEVF